MKKWISDLWNHKKIIKGLEDEVSKLKEECKVKDGRITTLSDDNNECKMIIIEAAETLKVERVEKNKFKLKNAILEARLSGS